MPFSSASKFPLFLFDKLTVRRRVLEKFLGKKNCKKKWIRGDEPSLNPDFDFNLFECIPFCLSQNVFHPDVYHSDTEAFMVLWSASEEMESVLILLIYSFRSVVISLLPNCKAQFNSLYT